jgi:coenzyme Q-binding protein COQ10
MPRFAKSIRVPYRPEDAFALVSDIARYPEFIKWITAMRVSDLRETSEGVRECLGDAAVGFKGFVERFSTRVVADQPAGRVTASLVRGPFRHLKAEWQITPLEKGGSDIGLDIDYAFRNPVVGFLAAANHDLAVGRILNAFLLEAQARFGDTASERR